MKKQLKDDKSKFGVKPEKIGMINAPLKSLLGIQENKFDDFLKNNERSQLFAIPRNVGKTSSLKGLQGWIDYIINHKK